MSLLSPGIIWFVNITMRADSVWPTANQNELAHSGKACCVPSHRPCRHACTIKDHLATRYRVTHLLERTNPQVPGLGAQMLIFPEQILAVNGWVGCDGLVLEPSSESGGRVVDLADGYYLLLALPVLVL